MKKVKFYLTATFLFITLRPQRWKYEYEKLKKEYGIN